MADPGATGAEAARATPGAVSERGRSLRNVGLAVSGVAAVVLAMLAGRSDLLGSLLQPPAAARWLLGAAGALIGVVLLFRAASRMGAARGDARALIRSVRMVFLAVAAFAAAAGWFLGSALPIVVALVIGGVDVLETTLLLIVTAANAPAAIGPTGTTGAAGAAADTESPEAAAEEQPSPEG